MPTSYNSNTFLSTYKDDYADSDNYYRILFNSGRALQARELTQLQTIIQEEMARFGSYVFKDGAVVNPGGYTLRTDLQYVALDESVTELTPQNKIDLVGVSLTGGSSGLIATVDEVKSDTDKGTVLYVTYTNTSSSSGSGIPAFTLGESLTPEPAGSLPAITVGSDAEDVGFATKIYVSKGSFFIKDHFVFVPAQELFLSLFTNENVNATVGFKVTEDIITVADTDDLYDNQGATPNRSAPGADRYRIRLTLTTLDDIANIDEETFIFYYEVANSTVVEELQEENQLSQIRDILAARTKEESGDYIVDPFRIRFDEDSDRDYVQLIVEPGVAYVEGYRAEHTDTTPLRLTKPRETEEFLDETIVLNYGNFCEIDSASSGSLIEPFNAVDLKNGSNTTIGTAFLKSYSTSGTKVFAHLFDIQMNSGQLFNSVASVVDNADANDKFTLATTGELQQVDDDQLLFNHASYVRPFNITTESVVVQRYHEEAANGSGEISNPGSLASDEIYEDLSEWIIYTKNGTRYESATVSYNGGNTKAVNITGLNASVSYTIIYYVEKQGAQFSSKNRTVNSSSVAKCDSDGSGGDIKISTGVTDIVKINNIWIGNSDSANSAAVSVLAKFELDDGRKDNYYDESVFRLKGGATEISAAQGPIYFSYEYFTHTALNDFFNFRSYGAAASKEYDRIGIHRTKSGQVYDLRDVYDFRSVIDPSTRTFTSGSAVKHEVPKRASVLRYDGTFYKGRQDKLVIGTDGVIRVVSGEQNVLPTPPADIEDNLTIYDIAFPPYTVNSTDIKTNQRDYKRYTMRDISQLEKRINVLEEKTALSMLELQADRIQLLDENGNPLVKNGFYVDDFSNLNKSETKVVIGDQVFINPDYKASSLAPRRNGIRPRFFEDDIALKFDSDLSSNFKRVGDHIYPDFIDDPTPLVEQNFISGFENVNPYDVIVTEGYIKLSPSSDYWKDSRRAADRIITASEPIVDASQALLWNQSEWGWSGRNPATLRPGDVVASASSTSTSSETTFVPGEPGLTFGGGSSVGGTPDTWVTTKSTTITSTVDRVVSNQIIREVTDDRVVETALIPWCRSRLIYFKAEGLKPNRTYFPFFDKRDVSNWCRQESFKTISDRILAGETIDYGNRYRSLSVTEHPIGGKTALVSDAVGVIEGSFWLPNTGPVYETWAQYRAALVTNPTLQERLQIIGTQFRTGVLEFLLTDVNNSDVSDALSSASTFYTAKGVLNVRQRTVKSTRHIKISGSRRSWTYRNTTSTVAERAQDRFTQLLGQVSKAQGRPRDPLAQSFYVNQKYVGGVHVTGGDLYVRTKSTSGVPLEVQLREVVNGIPVTDPIPGATAYIAANDVNVPSNVEDLSQIRAAKTSFTFDEPVYLAPENYYAIVLLTNTTEYTVYIAETEEFLLGSTTKRISKQPHNGSFFRSQNGSTWTPDQNADLAFQLNIAKFTQDATLYFGNEKLPSQAAEYFNPLQFDSGTNTVTVNQLSSGFSVGDTVRFTALEAGTYGGVFTEANLVDSNYTVTAADGSKFQFKTPNGTLATRSSFEGGDGVEFSQNLLYDVFKPEIATLVPSELCTVNYSVKQTKGFSYSQSDDVSISGKGNRDASFAPVRMRENNYRENPGIIFDSNNSSLLRESGAVIAANNGPSYSMLYKVDLQTMANNVAPYVDLERTHVSLISNLIDNQDSATSNGGFNVPITFVNETQPFGGSSLSKHITKVISLIDAASEIRVYLGADRPTSSSIDFYYRIGDAEENVNLKNWTLLEPTSEPPFSNPSPNSERKYGTFEYKITATAFYQFQFKFVMNSENSCRVPELYDLRAIATV